MSELINKEIDRMKFVIRELVAGDAQKIAQIDGGNGWNGDPQLWQRYQTDHLEERRVVFLAWLDDQPIGYVNLEWTPTYSPFRQQDIPLINNLSVQLAYRHQGVATALIEVCEQRARRCHRTAIGIGVGLYPDYGSAQRLYARLGYQPDGLGITYADRRLAPGELVQLDDDLVYWQWKRLDLTGHAGE